MLSKRDQATVAELAGGDLITHTLYATRLKDRRAPYGDADYIPYFITEDHPASGEELRALIEHHKREPFLLRHSQSGLALPITCARPGVAVSVVRRPCRSTPLCEDCQRRCRR